VQKLLRRYRLGRLAQRVAALAQLTAATTGILTTAAKDGPFGFCHFAARPGDLVALDTFYVGRLKGIGPVWQLTAVDTATRYGIGALVAGDKSARDAAGFVHHVAERLAGIGVELTGVLTDNGPEFTGKAFTSHFEHLGVRQHRIPPRSPNHNAVCERFQGTALQEFYRPAFHRQHFARLADLNAQFQRLAPDLQHSPPQPRRLHARPHALCGHGGAPIMTTPRVYLSPRPVLWKP
jgi:transposase InsO family protein